MKRTPFERIYPKLSVEDKTAYLTLLYTSGIAVPRQNMVLMGEDALNIILKRQEDLLAKYDADGVIRAVRNVKALNKAKIVRHYNGYIIMAQSEADFVGKKCTIARGDVKGFFTIEMALKLGSNEKNE